MPRAPRLVILLALACALFLRALVPAGWMPAEGEGAFAIELCPSAAAMPMADMGRDHSGVPAGHDRQHKDQYGDCAFSPMQAGFAPAQAVASIPAPVFSVALTASLSRSTVFTTGPPSLPPPATGPPRLT